MLVRDSVSERIPSRIIQTGRTHCLSPLAKASAANLKLLHPGWEYVYFDDADIRHFVSTEAPQYLSTFDLFRNPIQRIDFFRYLAIFKLGGFYFDLDVLLWNPLTNLLDRGAVFPFEEITLNRHLRDVLGMDWEIGNYAFGAAPGNEFLERVIENCVRAQKDNLWVKPMLTGIPSLFHPDFIVLNTTGPGLLSRTWAENPEAARKVSILFPDDVCNPETWHRFGAYGIHLMQGSWRQKGGYVRRRCADTWEAWVKSRCMLESVRMGPRRVIDSVHGC